MKRLRPLIALVLLIAPVAARGLWFYRGVYAPAEPAALPEYAGFALAQPPLATPDPADFELDAPGKVVLLDLAHENQFTMPELDALVELLNTAGARLELYNGYDTSLATAFQYASAYLVIAPTLPFSPVEVDQVERFVERGGRLLVITDPTRNGVPFVDYEYELDQLAADVVAANMLLRPFDLAFADDYLYNMVENEANYRNVFFREFGRDPLAEGLETVVFYAAHSVHTRSGTPVMRADEATLSSRTDTGGDLSAAALDAGGNVLALGDLTFLTPPYHQVMDNGRLISRLATFLLAGERRHDLDDFPYLFGPSVAVLPLMEDFTLDAEMVTEFAPLQARLELLDIEPVLAEEPLEGADLIVLGTYAPTNELAPYLEPFEIEMPDCQPEDDEDGDGYAWEDEPEEGEEITIPVPGVGNVACAGTGMLLYTRDEARATLVLLARTPKGLLSLLSSLSYGDLSSCVIQGNVGVCDVGDDEEDAGYEDDFDYDDFFPYPTVEFPEQPTLEPEEPEPEPTLLPELTPTPEPVG